VLIIVEHSCQVSDIEEAAHVAISQCHLQYRFPATGEQVSCTLEALVITGSPVG